ncbi:MAG: hypothetical protein CMB79_03710 [Filomicrobium sp.]|nr:hypothetical protein [Filomicrobium sp.]
MRITNISILFLALGLLGCEPKQADLYLPAGHPANPQSAPGLPIGAPGALRPEVTKAEPSATGPATQAPNLFSPTDRQRKSAVRKH